MWYRYKKVKHPTGDFFKDYRRVATYDYHEVDAIIGKLENGGYKCCQTDEGVLGSGNWICVPPEDDEQFVIIREIALNCWSSGHEIHYRKKLTKALTQELEDYYRGKVIE